MIHRRILRRRAFVALGAAVTLVGSSGTAHTAWAARPQGSGNAPAVPLPRGVERSASVEGITEYRLANGLRVLLFPDASKQTITVNITYEVGSRNENYGETGMAHLLEHLMFKGSRNHRNIPQELTEHGASPNGTTSYDRTNYFETFQATDANLDWALDLEADRMVNSFIARKDLDSEMTVVRNEYESGENSPDNILQERAISTAFLWHNYGKSTIGARSDIEQVPIERLQAFWRTYYQPDNAVLLVAGKVDEAKTLTLVQRKFGPIPKPTRVMEKTYTVEPTQDGERMVTLRRTGDVQALCAVYHIPAASHPDSAPVNVLAQILGDRPSGRLYKALVDTKKASSVYSNSYRQREPGVLLVGAQVRKEDSIEAARDAMLQTVEGVTARPITDAEVERAKTQLLTGIELSLSSSQRVGLSLSQYIAQGDWRLLFLNRDRLKEVTTADVNRVAAAYLKPSNRTLGVFLPTDKPDRAEIPATPDVAALVKDYKGTATIAAGEAFDPSPANIETRTKRSDTGGIKLALLSKRTRGNAVNATLTLRFGDENSLRNRTAAAGLAGALLSRGTTTHSRQQIEDAFDRLKAQVALFGGAGTAGATVQTTRENLPAVLRLVAEELRAPAFPADEFDTLKTERLAAIEQRKGEPRSLALNAVQRHLNPYPKGDVRYVETPDEEIADIQATTLDDVKAFHRDFYGASNGELAVVGDFDDKEIPALAGDLFGGWRSPKPYARVPDPYQDVPAAHDSFETPDKANAVFYAALPIKIRDDSPDYPALVLGNYMLGGGFLNSRLATRIRQREGLSYGVGSSFSASAEDESGLFQGFAIYNPQNAAKVETAFKEEIARALSDGFTKDEVEAAKSGYLQSRQVNRSQDNALAVRLAAYRHLNRTLAFDADIEAKIRALTPDQITAALRKYLVPAKISIITAGDFKKPAP